MGTAPDDGPRPFDVEAGDRRNGSRILNYIGHKLGYNQLSWPEQQIVDEILSSTELHRDLEGLVGHEMRVREKELTRDPQLDLTVIPAKFTASNQLPEHVAQILDVLTFNKKHAVDCDFRFRERILKVMTRKINSRLKLHNANITDGSPLAELIENAE